MTNARQPLVLIPGLLEDAALWRHQAEHLADVAEARVADITGAESVGDLARTVLAAAPGRFALAGHSLGGYVAFEIMRQAPERVTRLALVSTSSRIDAPEVTARRRGLLELAEKGRFKGVTPRLLPLLIHPDRSEDEPLTGTIMAMAERVGQPAFLRQQRAIMGRPDSRPGLGVIAVPTLVACGRQDQLTPLEFSAEIAAGIPGAVLVPIEDCGHVAPLERPQAVTALLRYWLAL